MGRNLRADTETTLSETTLTLAEAARIIREATRDHSYQQTRLGAAVREYLAWKRMSRAAARTLDSYERDLARMCLALADTDPDVRDVSPADLLLVLELFPEGSWHRARASMGDFFRWAVRWEKATRNPVELLPRLRRQSSRVYDIFDSVERAQVLKASDDSLLPKRDRLGALCFQELGLRKAEALGLRVSSFDQVGRVAIVTGKGDKQRAVPYSDELHIALLDFLHTPIPLVRMRDAGGSWREDRLPRDTDYVFFPSGATGGHGERERQLLWTDPSRPMSQTAMHGWWKRSIERADVRYRSLHMNRHTVATELVDADVDPFSVRDWLGHADTRTTEVYVHNARARLRRAAERLRASRLEEE